MKNEIYNSLLPIQTKRLILRKTTIQDIDLILKMDKQILTQKYLGGIKNKTKEERIEFLKNKDNNSKSLTVFLKDKPIGFIELIINNNSAELSYIFDSDYINNGYCTEASNKLIDIAFNELNLDEVTAETVSDNNSSKRVLEKLGFELIDTYEKDSVIFNKYVKRR